MTFYLNPKTGATIGYQETKGTTAEPFFVPMGWQSSSLSFVALKVDSGGNLATSAGNPTIVPASPATATAGSSSAIVVAANSNRTGLVITNLGTVNVFFGQGAAAVLNSGLALVPNGTWVMDRYTFYNGAIQAVCASTSTLAIQEYS